MNFRSEALERAVQFAASRPTTNGVDPTEIIRYADAFYAFLSTEGKETEDAE